MENQLKIVKRDLAFHNSSAWGEVKNMALNKDASTSFHTKMVEIH